MSDAKPKPKPAQPDDDLLEFLGGIDEINDESQEDDFSDFLAKTDTQVWWHQATGYVPVTTAAYEAAKAQGYYQKNPTREIAILQLNRGTPTANSQGFHFGNYTQTTFALREEMESVFANKKTPQQGLDDAVRRGNDILRQFEKLNAGKY